MRFAALAACACVVALLSSSLPAGARPDLTVPTVTISGAGLTPVTLTTAELVVVPQQTVTTTVNGISVIESGPTLSGLLAYAGVAYDGNCKNDELRYWVEVTSANGDAVEISPGELDTGFGDRPAILSINQDGTFLTAEGPTLVVPGDFAGIRNIEHVTKITVGRAPVELAETSYPACGTTSLVTAPPPGSVTINGDVKDPMTLSFAQLQALPQATQTDTFLSGSTPTTVTETGPTLYSVLDAAQPKFLACDPNDKLRFYVEVTSSEDGYASILSWAEIDPNVDDTQALLSLAENGASLASVGPRTTAPGDVKGGRYVSGTAVLTVFRAPTETRIPSCRSH